MSQLMPGKFLQHFLRVTEKGWRDVLMPPGWRMTYHPTTSLWKMPPNWHWTGNLEVIGSKWNYALK